jgi:hypothetical protein
VRKRPAVVACTAFGCGAIGLALASAGPAATGCTTHQCDQSSYDFAGGHMLDENTYVTNDIDSNWLRYNGNTTINILFPAAVLGRIAKVPVVEVGLGPNPNGGDAFSTTDNYTTAVGQLAIFNFLNTAPLHDDAGDPAVIVVGDASFGGGLTVTNSTCASYFVRVEVDFIPLDAGAATSSSPESGGSIDGGADAPPVAAGDAAASDALADAGLADAAADGAD